MSHRSPARVGAPPVALLLAALGLARAQAQPGAASPDVTAARPAPATLPSLPRPSPLQPNAPAPAPATSPAPAAALDFDLLGPEAQPSPDELARRAAIQRSLRLRRELLTLHQVAGFTLLAGMTTTVVLGQLNYSDKYGGGDTGRYMTSHQIAAYTTTGIFAAAGLLALLAPSPIDAPPRLSTSTLHKTAMAIATAGMVAEVVLGVLQSRTEGQLVQRNYALAHQINGYVTLGAVATGFTVLIF